MASQPLTQTTIADSSPGDVLRDQTVRGLHLRVFSLNKNFYFHYRTRSGIERRPKLGTYPQMTLSQARQTAKAVLASVSLGGDPSGEWQAERSYDMTLADLANEYLVRHAKKRKRTWRDDDRMLNRYVLSRRRLALKRVTEVTNLDIEGLHQSISAPYAANRVLSLISKMFKLAERWGYRPKGTNPAEDVERNVERKRERYLSPEEGARIGAQLRNLPPRLSCAYLLLIFTGARRSEIAGRALDIENGYLTLTRHKTDRSGEKRRILIPDVMLDFIGKHNLAGVVTPSPQVLTHTWAKVCKAAGVENLRLHDLRHTFASVGVSNGLTLSQVGPLLGHSSAETTNRYAHLMDASKREAVEAIAVQVSGLLGE
jgi:integrase